jgi:acyl carrier protein
MELDQIVKELNEVFIDVLDNEDIELSMETTAADIEEWDSLSHIMLIVNIEKKYKIKFTSIEIAGFKNVGELAKTIQQKFN